MKILLLILFILFLGVFLFDYFTKYLKQVYQFNMVIGAPGSGKSTMYTALAHYYLSRGYHVYGTDPIQVQIKDKKTRKTHSVQVKKVEVRDLYLYRLPADSVVLIDEIGVQFSNRDWKAFGKNNILFWKHYRHCHLIVWAWSQSWDCDVQLRNLVSQFWIQERKMRIFTVARRLIMKPVVVHPQGEGVARIADDFVEDPKLLRPILGGMKIFYLPRWIKQFDSFYIPEDLAKLQTIDYSDDPVPYSPPRIYSARREKRRNKRIAFYAKWRTRLERARQAYYVLRASVAFYAITFRKKLRRSK